METYVAQNHLVLNFTWRSIVESFVTPEINGSYNPVVLLHWMLEVHAFGLNATYSHVINLLWHAANAFLAASFVKLLTRNGLLSILVGSAFCLHPMNVEPVAWVTGRKDLLQGFFSLLVLCSITNTA